MSTRATDEQLIQECKDGKQEAWSKLIERYSNLVISVPVRYGLNASDSEDVMQTVFVRLFRGFENMREPKALPAWLLTTAHRETWRLGKSLKKTMQLQDATIGSEDPPEAELLLWEEQYLVRESLKTLGGKCQALLELLFLEHEKQSYGEIAKELNMPIGAIGPERARCFKKLIPILDSIGITDQE